MDRRASDRGVYVINLWADVTLIGGLSIVASLACVALEATGSRFPASSWAVTLAWIVNWPHFAATSWRLYRSRATMAQYPGTSIGIPLLVLAAVAACFVSTDVAAPAFVKLFVLWSPFHFSGQTLGLTLLYARRAGLKVGRLERAAFAGFIYSTYAWLILAQEINPLPGFFLGVKFPSLALPEWPAAAAQAVMHVFLGLALLAYGLACLRERRLVPPILLLPMGAQYVWFAVGSRVPDFNAFVPLFHSLQYLLIAWALQLKERMDEARATPSGRFVARESLRWMAIAIYFMIM